MTITSLNQTENTDTATGSKIAAPTVKHTGRHCRELTNNFWLWLGYDKSPAIALLPINDESNAVRNKRPNCIDYRNIGQVKTAGNIVVIERSANSTKLSKFYDLMEFQTPAEAQSFAKRIKRGKHQTLLVGIQCVRVVKISSQPDTNIAIVSHIGKEMTEIELCSYELLTGESFEKLVKELATLHKNGNFEDRSLPMVIGEVDDGKNLG
jgi:hypothetical protein